jgi:hypothetical protein
MINLPVRIRFEQAVYGTFPFWNRGYSVLALSTGCRRDWLAEMRTVCQRYGEPSPGVTGADSFFALRLRCGPWMIAGAYPRGNDDHDRPGALAFHALFVSPWAYRRVGANPFVFDGVLRREWFPADQDRTLPAGFWTPHEPRIRVSSDLDDDPRLARILLALTQGRRVLVQSVKPIDGLARSIWCGLPIRVRRRATLATWAFDNANHFDLVALPKLSAVMPKETDVVFAPEHGSQFRA